MNRVIMTSQHKGVDNWLKRAHNLKGVTTFATITSDMVNSGDVVIAAQTIPWPVFAGLCTKGARVLQLITNVPRGLRGKSLSFDELKQCRAFLADLVITPADVTPSDDVIIVTRHPGAQAWLQTRFPAASVVTHWEEEDWARIQPGTTLVGVFPPELVLRLNKLGGHFLALQFARAQSLHGQELTADDMDRRGALLQGYTVTPGEDLVCAYCGEDWLIPFNPECTCCGKLYSIHRRS